MSMHKCLTHTKGTVTKQKKEIKVSFGACSAFCTLKNICGFGMSAVCDMILLSCI